eukprot:snap_masked-scaffold_41-processed-gene-2.48-mRNA-1 protein AED:1.00 eAED:1.00 QI:0/0/0/0/1/1/2/0/1250
MGKKHYSNLCVTNEYFTDFARRKKRNFRNGQFDYLLIMTVLRQGNSDIIKFMLDNLPKDGKNLINDAHVFDGDMLHARWLSDEDEDDIEGLDDIDQDVAKLDRPPKKKYLIAHFEPETALSALLRHAQESRIKEEKELQDLVGDAEDAQEVQKTLKHDSSESLSLLKLVLKTNVDPSLDDFLAFKVAARYGQVKELAYLRKAFYVKAKKWKRKEIVNKKNQMYRVIIAHAAMENQLAPIHFVRMIIAKADEKRNSLRPSARKTLPRKFSRRTLKGNGMENTLRGSSAKKSNGASTFRKVMKEAVYQLIDAGKEDICTYRNRLIYGIYNILRLQSDMYSGFGSVDKPVGDLDLFEPQNIEEVQQVIHKYENSNEKRNSIKDGESSELKSASGLNNTIQSAALEEQKWTPLKDGILSKNQTINYLALTAKVLDEEEQASKRAKEDEEGFNKFETLNDESSQSKNTEYSSLHNSNLYRATSGFGATSLAKVILSPVDLFIWFVNSLSQNDYNADSLTTILFSLGLKEFFTKEKSKRRNAKSKSQASFNGGSKLSRSNTMISRVTGESMSVTGDDDDDAKSVTSNFSVKSGFSVFSHQSQSVYGAAKSVTSSSKKVLGDMGGLLGNMGSTVRKSRIVAKRHRGKDILLALELASQFGSEHVLERLLHIIAPALNKDVVQSFYRAVISNKSATSRLLLDRITNQLDEIATSGSVKDKRNAGKALKILVDHIHTVNPKTKPKSEMERLAEDLNESKVPVKHPSGQKNDLLLSMQDVTDPPDAKSHLTETKPKVGFFGWLKSIFFKGKTESPDTNVRTRTFSIKSLAALPTRKKSIFATAPRPTIRTKRSRRKTGNKTMRAINTPKNAKFVLSKEADQQEHQLRELFKEFVTTVFLAAMTRKLTESLTAISSSPAIDRKRVTRELASTIKEFTFQRRPGKGYLHKLDDLAEIYMEYASTKEIKKLAVTCLERLSQTELKKGHVQGATIIVKHAQKKCDGLVNQGFLFEMLEKVGLAFTEGYKLNEEDMLFEANFWPNGYLVIALVMSSISEKDKKDIAEIFTKIWSRSIHKKLPLAVVQDVHRACKNENISADSSHKYQKDYNLVKDTCFTNMNQTRKRPKKKERKSLFRSLSRKQIQSVSANAMIKKVKSLDRKKRRKSKGGVGSSGRMKGLSISSLSTRVMKSGRRSITGSVGGESNPERAIIEEAITKKKEEVDQKRRQSQVVAAIRKRTASMAEVKVADGEPTEVKVVPSVEE